MRTLYTLSSVWRLRKSLASENRDSDYWQAGMSVEGIHSVMPAADIVRAYVAELDMCT
jgi:nitronate monooxygenase